MPDTEGTYRWVRGIMVSTDLTMNEIGFFSRDCQALTWRTKRGCKLVVATKPWTMIACRGADSRVMHNCSALQSLGLKA